MELIGNYDAARDTMSQNANSQLVSDGKQLHIKLPPKFMGNIGNGVKHYLTSLMSKQERMGDAYPIAYTNIKILQPLGKLISDQPCIHFDVNADFIFFKPVVGCKLEGKVNKLGKRHLGCLVYGCFNAWVPQTPLTVEVSPEKVMGAEIEFTVVSISTNRNILSIKGTFDKFLSEELNKVSETEVTGGKSKKNARKKKTNFGEEDAADNTGDVADKDNDSNFMGNGKNDSVAVVGDDSIVSQDESRADISVGDENTSRSKKKKHKKDKKRAREMENGDVNNSIVSLGEPIFCSTQVDFLNDASINSTGKVKKHKKKRKHSTSVNELDDSVGDVTDLSHLSGRVNGEADISVITNSSQEASSVSQTDSKRRKRKLSENCFTKIKNRVADDAVLTEPSPAKKHKKHKKHSIEKSEIDSLDDFVVSSGASKKSKKKKKHRMETDLI